MEKVRGIGGIFFKAQDPKALAAWYADNLGVPMESMGAAIFRVTPEDVHDGAMTIFSPFPADTDYFEPSRSTFMINFRVDDVDRMHAQLQAAGAQVDAEIQASLQGRFCGVMDPEGNRIELWEPKAAGASNGAQDPS